MHTIEQAAAEIEQLKPDLTDFITSLECSSEDAIMNIRDTINISLKALKAEVALIFFKTHPQKNPYSIAQELCTILKENISDSGIVTAATFSYNALNNYFIVDSFNSKYHILAQFKDPKPYLPKYLWDKIRIKRKLITEQPKQLEPNDMSLRIFKAHLQSSAKSMNSVQAVKYLEQIKDSSFNTIRQGFIEAIFEKCTKPSINLQKKLADTYNGRIPTLTSQESTEISKYMYLCRPTIRGLARSLNIPVSITIYDTLDSEYKPFITNLYRIPDETLDEVSYLFNVLIILQVSVSKSPNPVYEYFIEHITKHLQAPQSAELVTELKKSFSLTNGAFNKLTI